MKSFKFKSAILAVAIASLIFSGSRRIVTGHSASSEEPSHDYPVQTVPFTAVHLNDDFWKPKIETNRTVTIPYAFDQCERTGRVGNFIRAAQAIRGETLTDRHAPAKVYDDTDIYKIIEGASYTLSVHPDPKLDAYVDELIAKVAAAQEPDGYIYTSRTIKPDVPDPRIGAERWEKEEILSHELYDAGHLYESAVAHYQATGKRNLLNVAVKNADLLVRTFGPGKRKIYPGHQIIEMGLVRLYRVTGNEQYLDLAKFLLDSRGPGGTAYNQADLRVIDQTEAEGHAVRATYMYSGMADVAALTGDASYLKAIDAIWENVVTKKLYITGGIGATGVGEAFGKNYELPNMTAYNETCASVGNDYWNYRLFLLHGDARYIDVMERTLYNGLISGVSSDGKLFFYSNPLESNGQHTRSPWFGTACCPGNTTRFLASVPGYVYAKRDHTIYVNLFASGTADIDMNSNQRVHITQETRYPWDGHVSLTITPDQPRRFAIKMRIPGWARGEVVPGDLYHFVDTEREPVKLQVNGRAMTVPLDKGYATLEREWTPGDKIQLYLPMPVRRITVNAQVSADRGRIALQRGPLVYAAEWPDNPNGRVRNLVLSKDEHLTAEYQPGLLSGVVAIQGQAVAYSFGPHGEIKQQRQPFTAIPYYAWANRGPGQMAVWIADSPASVRPAPYPSLAMQSKVTSSGEPSSSNGIKKEPKMVADGEEPTSSSDLGSSFDWLPKRGSTEWIQYTFEKPATVSKAEVYWADDASRNRIRTPVSWRLLYENGSEWKPVETQQAYGLAKDRYNVVTFEPVKTDAVRLEFTMQPQYSAGIQEWKLK
jgi:uncharacterized protein